MCNHLVRGMMIGPRAALHVPAELHVSGSNEFQNSAPTGMIIMWPCAWAAFQAEGIAMMSAISSGVGFALHRSVRKMSHHRAHRAGSAGLSGCHAITDRVMVPSGAIV